MQVKYMGSDTLQAGVRGGGSNSALSNSLPTFRRRFDENSVFERNTIVFVSLLWNCTMLDWWSIGFVIEREMLIYGSGGKCDRGKIVVWELGAMCFLFSWIENHVYLIRRGVHKFFLDFHYPSCCAAGGPDLPSWSFQGCWKYSKKKVFRPTVTPVYIFLQCWNCLCSILILRFLLLSLCKMAFSSRLELLPPRSKQHHESRNTNWLHTAFWHLRYVRVNSFWPSALGLSGSSAESGT